MVFDLSAILLIAVLGALFVRMFLRECLRNPAFVFTAAVFYAASTITISVIYLELVPTFISESGTVSDAGGAWWRILIYNMLVFVSAAWTIRAMSSRSLAKRRVPVFRPLRTMQVQGALASLALLAIVEMANFALSKSLPLPGAAATRWNYWSEYAAFPFLADLPGTLIIFMPVIVGMLIFMPVTEHRKMPRRKFAFGFGAGYFFYLILSGQRFHGLLFPALTFLAIYALDRMSRKQRLITPRGAIFALVVVVIVAINVLMEFQNRGISDLAGSAEGGIIYRMLVIQGHTYWNIDQLMLRGSAAGDWQDLVDGVPTLISLVLDPSLQGHFLESGVTLAAGLPTTFVLVFGFFGAALACVIYGIGLGLVCQLMFVIVRDGRLLLAVPGAYVHLWYAGSYPHGSLAAIFSVKFAIGLTATLLALAAMRRRRVVSSALTTQELPLLAGST